MEQSKLSSASSGGKFLSRYEELDSMGALSFADGNGSSNFLVSIGSSPASRHQHSNGSGEQRVDFSARSGILAELAEQTVNMPLDISDLASEFSDLAEMDSDQFGRNPESALYDPINDSKSFARPSMNSAASIESTARGEMTRYFSKGSGPMGSLTGDFNSTEPVPFSAYLRPRAPSDESNAENGRQIPFVTTTMMEECRDEPVAPTFRISSASSRPNVQNFSRLTDFNENGGAPTNEMSKISVQSSVVSRPGMTSRMEHRGMDLNFNRIPEVPQPASLSVYSSTVVTETCDLSTASDEGLSERYLCMDVDGNAGEERHREEGNRSEASSVPTQSTPKHPGLERESPMRFEENFSAIENTFCGFLAPRPPSGENRVSNPEEDADATQTPHQRESFRDRAETPESDGRSMTPASTVVSNRPWTPGAEWNADRREPRVSDTNSTLTQGSNDSNISSESGAGYYRAGLVVNGPGPAPAYIPEVIDVPDKICVGVRSAVNIPIVNVTAHWLHCSPSIISVLINGEAISDRESALFFPKHVVTVKPEARTTVAGTINCDRTGRFEAEIELEIGEVVQGMPGVRREAARPVRFMKKVVVRALVDAPQVEIEPMHPDLMEESVLNLGCFPERCAVNEKFVLKNRSSFQVPVRVWLEGRDAFTRLFQLNPCVRNPTDMKAENSCPGFTTDLADNEEYEFSLFLKTPTLQSGRKGSEYPSTHINVRLVVDLNGPEKRTRRLAAIPVVCILGVARPLISLTDGILRIPCQETRAFSIRNAGNVLLRLAIEIESPPSQSSSSDSASSRARTPNSVVSAGSSARGADGGGASSTLSSCASSRDERSCFTVSPKRLDFMPEEEKCVRVAFHPPPTFSAYGAGEVCSVLHLMVEPDGETFYVSLRGLPQPTSCRSSFVSGNNRIPAGRDAPRRDQFMPLPMAPVTLPETSSADSATMEKSAGSQASTAVTLQAASGTSGSTLKSTGTMTTMTSTPKAEPRVSSVKSDRAESPSRQEPKLAATKHMYLQNPSIVQQFSKDTRREVSLASALELTWYGVDPAMWAESNFSRIKITNNSKRDAVLLDLMLLHGNNCEFFFVSENGKEYSRERQFLHLPVDSSFTLRLYCRIEGAGDMPYFRGRLKMKTAHPDLRGRPIKFTINLTAFKGVQPLRAVDLGNEDVTSVYLQSEDANDGSITGTFFLQNPNEQEHCFVFMSADSSEGIKVKIDPDCYLLSPKEVKCFYVSAPSRKSPLRKFGSITLLSGLESLRRAALKANCTLEVKKILVTQRRLREHWSPLGRLQEPLDQPEFPAPSPDALLRALSDGTHETTLSLIYGELDSSIASRTLVPSEASTFFQSTESFMFPAGLPSSPEAPPVAPPVESFMDLTTNLTRELPFRSPRTWDVHPVVLRFDTGQVMVKPLEVRNWLSSSIRVSIENPSEDGLIVRPASGTVAGSSSLKFLVDISRLNPARRSNSWKLKVVSGNDKKEVSVMVSPFVVPEPCMSSSASTVRDNMSSAFSEFSGSTDISTASRVRAGLGAPGEHGSGSQVAQKTLTLVLLRESCDFGECGLGGTLEEIVPFRVDGSADKIHWKVEPPKGYGVDSSTLAFVCRTPSGRLPSGQTGDLIFVFEPLRAISYAATWTLVCRSSDGSVEKAEVRLSGRGRDARQPLPRQSALSETTVAPSSARLTDSIVSSVGSGGSETGSKSMKSSRELSCFQDVSMGSVKTPSSESTLLELDRNIIEFPVVKLGGKVEPHHTKLRLTNHSKTSFELHLEPMPEPFRHSPLPKTMLPRRYESFLISFAPTQKGIFQCVWTIKAIGRPDISPLRVKLFGKAV